MTYRGKSVPERTVSDAALLLDVWHQVTGRRIRLVDGTGRISEQARQVVGALLARPDVTAAEWRRAIENTYAAPPQWAEGPLRLGYVFGAKASEWALTNTGAISAPAQLTTSEQASVRKAERMRRRIAVAEASENAVDGTAVAI